MQQQLINLPEILPEHIAKRDGEGGWYTATDGTAGRYYMIEPDKIRIREGFNGRFNFGDIEGLAQSILENGQVHPGYVDALAGGTFALTDGERRFRAVMHLWNGGNRDIRFKAFINDRKITEAERLLQMFATQDNKQLEPVEAANVIQRLHKMGYEGSAIAKKIGKSTAYVSNMLSFSTESPVIHQAVADKQLTVTGALALKKAIPSQAARNEAVSKAVDGKAGKLDIADVSGRGRKKSLADLAAENENLKILLRRFIAMAANGVIPDNEHSLIVESKSATT